jgi:hypothetical protein
MIPCDREGIFRGKIEGYGLRDADKTSSLAVTLQVRLTELWDGDHWEEWSQYDMEATGDIWIIKKDGTPNENGVRSLVENAGWDASIDSVYGQTWQPTPVQVVVKRDDYKGEVRFRIEFVNTYDRTPGAVSTVSSDKARELSSQHGAALRAIAGNVKRNGPPGPGGPVKPPAPGAVAAPVRPATPPAAARVGTPTPKAEEIPF